MSALAPPALLLVVPLAGLLAMLATLAMMPVLKAWGFVDRPSDRSLHTKSTIRGGGVAILMAVVPAWGIVVAVTGVGQGFGGAAMALGLLLVAGISLADDKRPVAWRWRLLAHVLAVLLTLTMFAPLILYVPDGGSLALVLAGGVVVWFGGVALLNATNFMDGSDGLVATYLAGGSAILALAFVWLGAHPAYPLFAASLSAALLGFLVFNWPPAKLFMGDVGSVPLGLLFGFLGLSLALLGGWGVVIACLAYFAGDTGLTLIRRRRAGAKLSTPHREHAYQRAAGLDRTRHARLNREVIGHLAIVALASVAGLVAGGWPGQLLTALLGVLSAAHLLRRLEAMAREPVA